jgi:hypothetical protein
MGKKSLLETPESIAEFPKRGKTLRKRHIFH